jgi:hypothetical protein
MQSLQYYHQGSNRMARNPARTTVMQIELAYPNTVSKPATNMKSRIAILLSSLSEDEIEDGEGICT